MHRTIPYLLFVILAGACATQGNEGPSNPPADPNSPAPQACAEDCSKQTVDPCHESVCDETTGACTTRPSSEGSHCDDGLFCTVGERCVAGQCTGGAPNTCDLDSSCQAVDCHESTKSCTADVAAPDGTECISADLCLVFASCKAGQCIGTPKDCSLAPLPNCHVGECNPNTGICDPVPALDGAYCEDENDQCKVDKICEAGVCQGGAPKDCSALSDGCNEASCDAKLGCMPVPKPNGTSCTEGDDDCNAGNCDGQGSCHATPINEGGSCDDGLTCTTGSSCSQGHCEGGVGNGLTIYFAEDFSDNSQGWTLGPEWEIGKAKASSGADWAYEDPEWDHSPSYDDGVAGVVLGGHAKNDMSHPMSYLESPAIDTTGTGPVYVSFARWLNTALTVFVYDTIEVFDGSQWVLLWHNSGGGVQFFADDWKTFQYDITAHRSAGTRLRFGFQGVASVFPLIASWNVDDVIISNQSCL